MRLLLRPLFLITFVLGFVCNVHAIRANTPVELHSFTAKTAVITGNTHTTNAEYLPNENPIGSFIGQKPITGTMYFQNESPDVQQFLLFEENSYKNQSLPLADSYSFSENSTSVREQATTDQGILFRQGMFYGFALMLVLLNLVCYFLFDEKVFMHYSLALLALTCVFFYVDGLTSLVGFGVAEYPQLIQSTLLWVATGFSAIFAARYLTLKEFFPKFKYITAPLMATAGLLILMSWVTAAPIVAKIANVVVYSVMASYFLAGVLLFSRKNYAKFYVIAYCIPLLFAIDFFVLRNLGIGFLFTEAAHIKAAVVVEMLILTYAIMYRMRAIKEEHQLRQTELRIFLKRQESLNRRTTERLLEDVYLENLIMHYDLDGLEIKLLQYISEGKDNAKIARKLKVSEIEVEHLTKDLYEKLEISEHIQEDYRMVDSQPDYIYN